MISLWDIEIHDTWLLILLYTCKCLQVGEYILYEPRICLPSCRIHCAAGSRDLGVWVLHNASVEGKSSKHYCDVIVGTMASRFTRLTIVYSTVYSDADQRTHQSSASLAFVRGIHRGPMNSPHKWPVTLNTFPFDDVI